MTPAKARAKSIPPIEAGAAITDITPDRPVYLGGYGIGPVRKCTGIASRLYARAMAFASGETTIAVVAIDTHGLLAAYNAGPYGHVEIETASIAAKPQLTGVLSASTHSHCAPDSTGIWGGLPPAELERITLGAVEAVTAAIDSLTPAEISFGQADATELLRNQCDFSPHDQVDGRLSVASAYDKSARPVGRVVQFAAHATVGSGREISSDWYGALAKRLDDELGGTTVVLPGAIGRTQPAVRGDGSTGAVNAYASKVHERALEAIASAAPVNDPNVGFASSAVSLPISNPVLRAAAMLIGRPAPINEVRLSLARVGPLIFAGFPGEAYPNIGWQLEADPAVDATEHVLTVSLAGDQIGYLIHPANSFRRILRDAYKNDNSYFCPNPRAGGVLIDAALRLAATL